MTNLKLYCSHCGNQWAQTPNGRCGVCGCDGFPQAPALTLIEDKPDPILVRHVARVLARNSGLSDRTTNIEPWTRDAKAAVLAVLEHVAAPEPQPRCTHRELLQQIRSFLSETTLESGYCCCGSAIGDHDIGSGHAPVDELTYQACLLIEKIDKALEKNNG